MLLCSNTTRKQAKLTLQRDFYDLTCSNLPCIDMLVHVFCQPGCVSPMGVNELNILTEIIYSYDDLAQDGQQLKNAFLVVKLGCCVIHYCICTCM